MSQTIPASQGPDERPRKRRRQVVNKAAGVAGPTNPTATAQDTLMSDDEISDYGTEVISISVGTDDNQKKFVIHKNLLIARSDYFFAMFRGGGWIEAQTGEVTLDEDDPTAFDLFQKFVYRGGLFRHGTSSFRDRESLNGREVTLKSGLSWDLLLSAWQLGQKLLSTSFRDAVVDACRVNVVEHGKLPLPHQVKRGCHMTARHYGLRKLLVDITVWHRDPEGVHIDGLEYPREFVFDVAYEAGKKSVVEGVHYVETSAPPVMTGSVCRYHEHDGE